MLRIRARISKPILKFSIVSKIRLITLDLDNTLWDVDSIIIKAEKAMVQWLTEHVPEAMAHYQRDNLMQIRARVLADFKDKAHDLSFMRTQVLFEVMQHAGLNDKQAREMAQRAFDVFFEGRNQVVFFPGAIEMLGALSERFPLYALTNGNANVEKAGLSGFLHGAYSSADVGASKPHPDMFHAPLQHLGLKPSEAIHIGDHLVDDIAGAADVGMHTIWVNLVNTQRDADDPLPTREVSNLAAVETAVEHIDSSLS